MAEPKSSLIKTGTPRRYKRPANPREGLRSEDWAYAAGVIDGEGGIYIARSIASHGRHYTYSCTVRVFNTDSRLVESMLLNFGGTVYYRARHHTEKHKAEHTWVLSGKSAGVFLAGVSPFLKLKRQQAELLEKLIAHQRQVGHRRDPDGQALRESIYWQVRQLNQKGPPATTEREDALAV